MICYSYPPGNPKSFIRGLAKLLKTTLVNGRLIIPKHIGEGYIDGGWFSDGFSYIVMNFVVYEEFVMIRNESETGGLSLFFNGDSVSDYLRVSDGKYKVERSNTKAIITYLSALDHELTIRYSSGCHVRRIGVFATHEFLRKNVGPSLRKKLQTHASGRLLNISLSPVLMQTEDLMEKIFREDRKSTTYKLSVEGNVKMLIERFLRTFTREVSLQASNWKERKFNAKLRKLEVVEKVLVDPELKTFPAVGKLAVKASMSSTVLKTEFKKAYGLTMYQYFLAARLIRAKDLLEGGASCKMAGATVGYTNLSNFSKAFKEQFGIPPKMVKPTTIGQTSNASMKVA